MFMVLKYVSQFIYFSVFSWLTSSLLFLLFVCFYIHWWHFSCSFHDLLVLLWFYYHKHPGQRSPLMNNFLRVIFTCYLSFYHELCRFYNETSYLKSFTVQKWKKKSQSSNIPITCTFTHSMPRVLFKYSYPLFPST